MNINTVPIGWFSIITSYHFQGEQSHWPVHSDIIRYFYCPAGDSQGHSPSRSLLFWKAVYCVIEDIEMAVFCDYTVSMICRLMFCPKKVSVRSLLKPNYMSGQLRNSTTNGVIRPRPVQQRKPLNM